ncbi:phosphoenolpyruvate carboxylase [Escherichia coli]
MRQESTRHTEALGQLTRYLGIGDYESWSEADKQAFLIRELNSKRPLLPRATCNEAPKRAKCSIPAR